MNISIRGMCLCMFAIGGFSWCLGALMSENTVIGRETFNKGVSYGHKEQQCQDIEGTLDDKQNCIQIKLLKKAQHD